VTKSILVACLSALLVLSAGQAPPSQAKLEDLDALFAPIALYPDALLGPILVSAANPATIGALSEWLHSHETVKGTALQDAARSSNFGESFVALVLFPPVVHTMAERIEWTTKIGQTFTADRSAAFASIQRLRTKARDAGKLKTNEKQSVTTETTATGEAVIVIEPANPQLVYVPQYNPQTVYVPSTVVIKEEDDDDAAVAAGLIGFTAGIALGAAINDNYYYGPYGWGGGFRMYDDDFDDWYDHREDAREDWMDNREDLADEIGDRGDRARSTQEQRTARTDARADAGTSGTRERTATGTERSAAGTRTGGKDAARTSNERSGTRSDAFSGYSNGRSERAASSRGASSRSSSRGGGRRR